jgi:hypothetical protein
MVSLAARSPHRSHLSLGLSSAKDRPPPIWHDSTPFRVFTASQLPHSIFRPAPKSTKSAAVLMCLVDMHHRYACANVS